MFVPFTETLIPLRVPDVGTLSTQNMLLPVTCMLTLPLVALNEETNVIDGVLSWLKLEKRPSSVRLLMSTDFCAVKLTMVPSPKWIG